jgi:porin
MPFLRAGVSQGKAALYKASISAGLGYYTRQTDLAGIGFNWSDPGNASTDDQFTMEAFYRFTVSPNFAVTPSIQLIINPALDPAQDSITILGLRGRIAM